MKKVLLIMLAVWFIDTSQGLPIYRQVGQSDEQVRLEQKLNYYLFNYDSAN